MMKWALAGVFSLGMTVLLFCFLGILTQSVPRPVENTAKMISITTVPKAKPEPKPVASLDHGRMIDPVKMKFRSRNDPDPGPVPRLNLVSGVDLDLPDGMIAIEKVGMSAANFGVSNVFSTGDLDAPLVPLARMQPVYPFGAKKRRVQGYVTVRFVVTAQGMVEQVSVIEADPPGVFDHCVIRCVSGWRFKPGTVKGIPVNTLAETTIMFELKQS